MRDLIIIGGGPAGITAGIYAKRAGYDVLILEEKVVGGQTVNTEEIDNYLGLSHIKGYEFGQKIKEQAKELGIEVDNKGVKRLELDGAVKKIFTNSEEYECKTVVLANGCKRRNLNCNGETEFAGRGVSYCATCDGMFYRNKTVAVVGGGNTAIEDALYLSNLCEKVYLIHRRSEFRASKQLVDKVFTANNIEVIFDAKISEIRGSELVEEIELDRVSSIIKGVDKTKKVDGVFIAVGYQPDVSMIKGQIELTKEGYIITDENCKTNIDGVYAAGDCRQKNLRQIITAAADGAIAGNEAAEYLQKLK